MKERIEIIAIDLDDTLLDHDLTIPRANREAVRRASAEGIHVVLASGRNIHSMERYAEELGLTGRGGYLVCSNGAEIVELDAKKTVVERKIPPEDCELAAAFVTARGFPYQLYSDGKIHASTRNKWTEEDTRLTGQPNLLITDRRAHFKTGQLKFVVPGEPDELPGLEGALKAEFGQKFTVFRSKPYFLEILRGGVDKGSALAELAGILGAARERVMAIGDAMNDYNMLLWAGLPCAPANAIPAVKAIAHHVSPLSHGEGAVADLIDRFALGREGPTKSGSTLTT